MKTEPGIFSFFIAAMLWRAAHAPVNQKHDKNYEQRNSESPKSEILDAIRKDRLNVPVRSTLHINP
jgi:hypothetical protein